MSSASAEVIPRPPSSNCCYANAVNSGMGVWPVIIEHKREPFVTFNYNSWPKTSGKAVEKFHTDDGALLC